jgi:hypothetical protein
LWVSTPTVTRDGSRCAMVVLPSFLLGRVVAPAGRADNTATSLVATGSYQVTPLRSVPLAAAMAVGRQVLSQAPGRWGQGSDPRHSRDRGGRSGRSTDPRPGITPVAYRVRPHRDHQADHRSGVLGDGASDGLGRPLARAGLADGAQVELGAPAGHPGRGLTHSRTGHGGLDGGCLPARPGEAGRGGPRRRR